MEIGFNKKLVEAILKMIPENIKPVTYFTSVLGMSRESAYRRIRGDIPFTTDELSKLAAKLNFSVDNIVDKNNSARASFDFYSKDDDPVQIYLQVLEKYNELLENMFYSERKESLIALNDFPPAFRVFFDHLFNFSFYKWLHQAGDVSFNQQFSAITLPDEMILLQKKIKMNMPKIDNSVLILDPNIFSNLAKDIQYYFHLKLIDADDFHLLKEDLKKMVDLFETIAQTGVFDSKTKLNLYLSSLHIGVNTAYFSYGDIAKTMIWVFAVEPVTINNLAISGKQKKWLLALRKQSSLISLSNEILQTNFFDRQREMVEEI
jgi:hypothetical protein